MTQNEQKVGNNRKFENPRNSDFSDFEISPHLFKSNLTPTQIFGHVRVGQE